MRSRIQNNSSFVGWCQACCLAVALLFAATAAQAQVRISQVYTQGGTGGTSSALGFNAAPYEADFVELYNAGASAVDISGWSIQFAGATSTTTWTKFDLTGAAMIQPNSYFLIQLTDALSNGGPYPSDLQRTGTTASSLISSGGKVALFSDQVQSPNGACPSGNIVDLVGISGTSTANCSEGTPVSLANDARLAVFRKCGGTVETNNNSGDFETRNVWPRWSGSGPFPGIEVSVSLSTTNVGPCIPTTSGFQSVIRGVSSLLITASRTTCSGAPSTGGTVTADLSALGGSATQTLFDNATNGDVTAGDNIYSYNFNVPANATLGANQPIIVTITDAQGRTQDGIGRILVENPAPSNDVCASATPINTIPFSDTGINNRLANDDSPQPSCLSGATIVRRGVWYTYTATQTGYALISASATPSPVLAVFSGATCATLTNVACFTAATQTNKPVPMTSGTTYWILVGPSSTTCPSATLDFSFDFAVAPVNDDCTNATDLNLAGLPYSETVQNIAANDDFGVSCAPAANASTGKRGVWYKFVPPSTGIITMNESGSQNAMHTVYSGTSCIGLTEEFCSTTDTNQGTAVSAGTTYYILLSSDLTSAPTSATPFEYSFTFTPLSPPSNDTMCTALDVSAGGNFVVDNRAADDDNVFTLCLGSGSNFTRLATFYKYTASSDCVLKIEESSNQNISITAYQGPNCNSLSYITCTNNESMILQATSGQSYWIMIGHPGPTFTFPTQDLNVTFTCAAPPANDEPCNAMPLTSGQNVVLDTSFALPDIDVSCNSSSATNTWHGTWYTYMPASDCTVRLNEAGSQNVVMALFTGDCFSLVPFFCTDTDTNEYVDLFMGQTYYILVGINSSSAPTVPTASIDFTLECTTPVAGDACLSANTIGSLPFIDVIDNSSFTNNNPNGACDQQQSTAVPISTMRNDVWYKYTATQNCTGIIHVTPPSTRDYVVQVFQGATCQSKVYVGCSDAHATNGASEYLNIAMVAGQTYWIQYGKTGSSAGGGSSLLEFSCETPLPNDLPCGATVITSAPFFDAPEVWRATHDVWMNDNLNDGVNLCGTTNPSSTFYGVWYTYTPTQDCTIVIEDTSSFEANFGVFVGNCNNLTQLDCTGAVFDILSYGLQANTQYWFLVGYFGFSQPDPGLAQLNLSFDCRMAPENDLACNAIYLNETGLPYSESVDVAAATGDPDMSGNCNASGATESSNGVWYSYSPPADCTLTVFETSSQNAAIAIYEGFDCNSLFELTCTGNESISYALTGGHDYWILVALGTANPGIGSTTNMEVTIDCSSPPDNDAPCGAHVISATPYAETESITLATDDGFSACNSSQGAVGTQKSVWWRYTPATDCVGVINETSSLNVEISINQGSDCNNTFEVGCTAADNFAWQMFAGQTYWIMIGLETTTPTVPTAALSMTFDCVDTTPPANDLSCGATVINSLPYIASPLAATATDDQDIACNQASANSVNYGVWYQYTPAADCTLMLGESSANNVVWAIYSGVDCNNLNEVGCTATDSGTSIPLTSGTPYWILVGLDWNSNGTPATAPGAPYNITIDCAGTVNNDDCASAQTIPSLPYSTVYTPQLATSGAPAGSCNSSGATTVSKDVWFKWTATSNCTVTLDLQDISPAFQYTQMAVVYEGADCNNLFEVACGYNLGVTNFFPIVFNATAGQTYWFQNGGRGSITLGATEFTLTAECTAGCGTCPGDLNGDSSLDGEDIQKFTDCVISSMGGAPASTCECADIVVNQIVDMNDVNAFVTTLLSPPPCP